MSISISPAITTTPALDSLFPIYWDDLTEEEKLSGIQYTLGTSDDIPDSVDITVTPTPDWYAGDEEAKGTPKTYTAEKENGKIVAPIDVSNGEIPISPDFAIVRVVLTIQSK